MTSDGKVSIVIPCFNQGALLIETLKSIEQVRNDAVAEVIIVDDGSTEAETIRIIDELDRTKYNVIRQKNGGLGRARNVGIRAAEGEYILPVDSDNLIRATYLSRGVEILRSESDIGVVYGNAELFGEQTGPSIVGGFDLKKLVLANSIDACALYRKCVWESVNGYDECMRVMGYEDWDFWLRVAARGWAFAKIDSVAFDYRVRNGSMITETKKHHAELVEYMFRKPEYRIMRLLRDLVIENGRIDFLVRSRDYRLGRMILAPARRLKGQLQAVTRLVRR